MEYTGPGTSQKIPGSKIHWPKTVLGPNSKLRNCNYRIPRDSVSQELTAVGKNPVTLKILVFGCHCLYVSTTPITAMGCRQCLPLSAIQLKGNHCRKPQKL